MKAFSVRHPVAMQVFDKTAKSWYFCTMSKRAPIWLIGLDGASFDILDPMITEGRLPVIANLLENGASGVLRSNIAPFTPQAWASVITGKNPGKHGVFGFVREMPGCPPEFLSSRSINGDRLWTWFGRGGLSSLVMNVPLTYPPEPLTGKMITGMMTPSLDSLFTYPAALKDRVLSDYPDYRLDVRGGIEHSRNAAILDEIDAAVAERTKLAADLITEDRPDFLFLVFVLPDRIQHTFCRHIHPGSAFYDSKTTAKLRARIYDSYEKLDQALGRLLALAPPEANILIASDHGFAIERGAFNANDFLSGMGALTLRAGATGIAARAVINKFNVAAIKKFVPGRFMKKTLNFTKEAIDWSKTAAYASSLQQQGIFINLLGREPHGTVPAEQYEHWRDRIIEALNELKHPRTGQPVISSYRREQMFTGPFVDSLPDIILDFLEPGLEAKETVLGGPAMSWFEDGVRGVHHRDGIFIGYGPAINAGRFEGLVLEDIAPNILAMAGIEQPSDLDGRLRNDIFMVAGC